MWCGLQGNGLGGCEVIARGSSFKTRADKGKGEGRLRK